jgi:hypothetical protein
MLLTVKVREFKLGKLKAASRLCVDIIDLHQEIAKFFFKAISAFSEIRLNSTHGYRNFGLRSILQRIGS